MFYLSNLVVQSGRPFSFVQVAMRISALFAALLHTVDCGKKRAHGQAHGEATEDMANSSTEIAPHTMTSSHRNSSLSDFALYTYNFGNYRGLMNNLRHDLEKFARFGIDSFFFTDSHEKRVKGWRVVHLHEK